MQPRAARQKTRKEKYTAMQYVLCILAGYIIGSFNPSYIIGMLKGKDIRFSGSGNAGASNALLHFGKVIGILCAICDILKACLVVWLCGYIFSDISSAGIIGGCACILGHIFPFYMGFKGGKGLACYGGLVLMFDWRVFLIFLSFELIVVFITDYICFVPITACVTFPIVYAVMTHDIVGAAFLFAVAPVMLYKHRINIKRIKNGTEAKFRESLFKKGSQGQSAE